jgi:hypothetical protein
MLPPRAVSMPARWITDGATLPVSWREVEVSRYFEDETRDAPRCIEPLGNPNQGSLF